MANVIREPCDEGVVRSREATAPCIPDRSRWVLVATILGSSMASIDATVTTVALPAIQRDFDATAVEAQWVVESYALFLAALILVGGSLGDHLGRRRVFCSGVALFTAASVWCGLAPSPEQLIAARAVQGIGGAMLVPGSLAIISASFEEDRRGRAIGTWAGFTGITSVLGPVLGGFLIENLSWRWVFFMNVPLAVAVLTVAVARVPESRDEGARRLDPWGALLATLGLGGVVYGLIESSGRGLSDPLVLGALTIGVVALTAFVFAEGRGREPMMPLGMFRSRNFSGANLFTLLLYFAMGGVMFFLPLYLIQVQGYSATAAGAALVPAVLIMFFLSRYAGGLTDRFGAKLPLVVGPVIAACGFALYALPGVGGSYWTTFFPAVVVQGLGMSVVIPSLTTVALGSVEGEHSGLASGVNNAVARTASLLAVAVFGVLVFAAFSAGLDSRTQNLPIPPEARAALEEEKINLGAAEPPEGVDAATAAAIERAVDEAFVGGFRLVVLVGAGLALSSALAAAFLIEGRRPDDKAGHPGGERIRGKPAAEALPRRARS